MAAPEIEPRTPAPEEDVPQEMEEQDIRQILLSYLKEGRDGRRTGFEDRDTVWERNADAYWGRYNFSEKAPWQAKEVMPHVANSVERFASTMRRSLKRAGEWYDISDPQDAGGATTPMIKAFVDFFLERSGTNASKHRIGFDHTFGQLMKGGALKMICASVTWEDNRVRIDAVDPSEIFLDPSGRGLYRIRERKIDLYQLKQKKGLVDDEGEPLYDAEAIDRAAMGAGGSAGLDQFDEYKERSSGSRQEVNTSRKPLIIHEFLCDLIDAKGNLVATNQLIEMADERVIIRGPEPNPFWHGKDWIVCAPMIDVPWSVYGRTYVESFSSLAATFTEVTNLLLDAFFMTSMNAYMVYPEGLADPSQINDGIHPNKIYLAEQDWPWERDFIRTVELGQVNTDAFRMWAGIRDELREAAQENELALGQLAPNQGTTATEINAATRGGESIVVNIAVDVESTTLNPIVELTWMTALQHADPTDPELAAFLGPEWAAVLSNRRQDFRRAGYRVKANGLSGLIERGEMLRNLLGMLNVIGANDTLQQAFQQEHSISKLITLLLQWHGIDPKKLTPDPGEQPVQPQIPGQASPQGPGDLVDTGGGIPPPPAGGA